MGIVIMKVNHHINYRDFRVGANLADQSKPFVIFYITCWLQTWNLRFHNWCISFIFFYIQKNRTKVFAPITLLSTLILTIIISGDSKGSILETTCSNLSISHLFYIITVASLYNFADASTLLASAITIPELISVLKREFLNIVDWFDTAWKVSRFGVILVRIFPHLEWITPNTATFYAVCC